MKGESVYPMNPKVDEFLKKSTKWQEEFTKLREIVLDSPLTEEFKWGQPCYTLEKKNVLIIHGFKEYCAILFINGALLKDPGGILIQQTEYVQAARQIRFTSLDQIIEREPMIRAYIQEAIANERAGLQVNLKPTVEFKMPDEFRIRLDESPDLKIAFESLTPGRQRAYLFFFSAPKKSQTREARIEKCVPQILSGKGLND
jgi:uncharacterized protein YdeI (YjbR/CyaY-like superfamily)